jgi:hypothetical protein
MPRIDGDADVVVPRFGHHELRQLSEVADIGPIQLLEQSQLRVSESLVEVTGAPGPGLDSIACVRVRSNGAGCSVPEPIRAAQQIGIARSRGRSMRVREQAGCPDACVASWASRKTTAIGCGLFHGRRKDYAREDGAQPEIRASRL